MKKQHRTLIVMVVAVLTASVASFAMYRAIQRLGVREVEVAHTAGGGCRTNDHDGHPP